MSLTNCTECGQKISASADACPKCGHATIQATAVGLEPTDPYLGHTESPGGAVVASAAIPQEGSWSRFPTWLLFVLVFVGGSAILVAGVVAAGILIEPIVDEWEGFSTGSDTSAVVTTVTTVPAVSEDGLMIGQCLDDDELDKYLTGDDFSLASCDDPHDTEVYFRYDFPEGPYPGDEAVTEELKSVCREAFEGYVGVAYETSALSFWALWPTQGAWDAGNRLGECAVFDPDSNRLTGSAYQSGW